MKKYISIACIILLSIINFADEQLLNAVKEDNVIIVKAMEIQKKNFSIKDKIFGKNLLSYAIYNNSNKVASYLIKNKKYSYMINEISKDNFLPIEDAVLKENEEILKLLLENGAIIRKKDGNKNTVYDLATKFGKGKMVKILRDYELNKR